MKNKTLSRSFFLTLALSILVTSVGVNLAPQKANAWGRPWNGGHWIHDRHGGRLGWWWVVGPSWYYYARPFPTPVPQTVIIEQGPPQQPPVTVIQQTPNQPPPPAQVVSMPQQPAMVTPTMYYCKSTETYYPDTMTCPGGWTPVVAGAPPSPTAPNAK